MMYQVYLYSFIFIIIFLVPLWNDARRRPEYGKRPAVLLASLVVFALTGFSALGLFLTGASAKGNPLFFVTLALYPAAFIAAEYSVHIQRIEKNLLMAEFMIRLRRAFFIAAGTIVLIGLYGVLESVGSAFTRFALSVLLLAAIAGFQLFGLLLFDLQEGIIRRRRYLFIGGAILSVVGTAAYGWNAFATAHLFFLGLNALYAIRIFHEYFVYRMRHLNSIHSQHKVLEVARTELINRVLVSTPQEDTEIIKGILTNGLDRLKQVMPNPSLKTKSLLFFQRNADVLSVDSAGFIVDYCMPLLNLESLKRMKGEAAHDHILAQTFDLQKLKTWDPDPEQDFAAFHVKKMIAAKSVVTISPLPLYLGQLFRQIALFPVLNGDELNGMLVVFKDVSDYIFPQERTQLDEILGYLSIATTLIEGKRVQADKNRLNKEMDVAKQIQVSVLPKEFAMDGYDVAAEMITATEVGGDGYDYLPSVYGNYIGIGDVAGHGLPAGIMALIQLSALHAAVRASETLGKSVTPEGLYDIVNKVLVEINRDRIGSDKFMTSNILQENDGLFRYAGSHLVGLVYRSANAIVEEVEGMADRAAFLGLSEYAEAAQSAGEFVLAAEDVLLLYTDGLIEARDKNDTLYGMNRLKSVLELNGKKPAAVIKTAILDDLAAFAESGDRKRYGGSYADDVTLVVIRRL